MAWRTRGALAACALISLGWVAVGGVVPAQAADPWVVATASREPAEIRAAWRIARPTHTGSPYAQPPSTTSPYTPGTLQASFVADGLRVFNFGRYLAGLPADVTIDPVQQVEAQYGAVLLAASDFSHYPAKPPDMAQDFYDRGLAITRTSNLGWGYSSIADANFAYLDDSDTSNIDRLGHRRWIVNPPLKQTAFGFASGRTSTRVFDWSRTEDVGYDVIAYPSAGAFPLELIAPRDWFGDARGIAWHITLNPARYDWDTSGHTVRMRRLGDGRTWTFSPTDADPAGKYFSVDFGGYGVGNAFIFRPDSPSYAPGDTFEVSLAGGIYDEGTRTPAIVTYQTTLMALQPFADMTDGTQFFDEVAWMADKRISTGYPDGTYRPVSPVNRDAMAAFIYRSAGSPAFTPPSAPSFADVPPGSVFYKEIEWMRHEGLAQGWTVNGGLEYRPLQSINRDAMAAFLYRLSGSPMHQPPGQTFIDVPPGVLFYTEMEWLASQGITTGWTTAAGREFRPLQPINRDAMAAFLFRYFQNVGAPKR